MTELDTTTSESKLSLIYCLDSNENNPLFKIGIVPLRKIYGYLKLQTLCRLASTCRLFHSSVVNYVVDLQILVDDDNIANRLDIERNLVVLHNVSPGENQDSLMKFILNLAHLLFAKFNFLLSDTMLFHSPFLKIKRLFLNCNGEFFGTFDSNNFYDLFFFILILYTFR